MSIAYDGRRARRTFSPAPGAFAALLEALGRVRDDGTDPIPGMCTRLQEGLGLDTAAIMGFCRKPTTFSLDMFGVCGAWPEGMQLCRDFFAEVRPEDLTYDLDNPATEDRNRARRYLDIFPTADGLQAARFYVQAAVPGGFDQADEMRVLVCDGQRPLAFVVGFTEAPLAESDRDRFQAVVPALVRFFRRHRLLEGGDWVQRGMEAAMEALPSPAMLVDKGGRIRHLNGLARQLWVERRVDLEFLNHLGRAPVPAGFEVVPVDANGTATHYLVTYRGAPGPDRCRLAAFGAQYALSRRESQVLPLLVEGHTNRGIAEHLGCAPRTVEVHVRNLLRKTGAETRTSLTARSLGYEG